MSKLSLFLLALSAQGSSDPIALENRANQAYVAKDYANCADLYIQAMQAGAKDSNTPYNAACCFALAGKKDDAFKYLTMAFENGWRETDHLKTDIDLASLHADPRWTAAISRCQAAAEKFRKSVSHPELMDELLKRMAEDQAVRMSAVFDERKMIKVDKANTAWMKQIVKKYGWPGKSMVGKDAALGAFLIVQHAEHDDKFQAQCLELMKKASAKDEVRRQDVAFLTDRVLLTQGKKQLYGTQFITKSGKMAPAPIEDEPNLDARRTQMGLGPFSDYKKMMEGMSGG